MMLRSIFVVFFCSYLSITIAIESDSLRGLQTDILLHPADGFTAYTLKKNELVYCQSPFTLPFPSWAWWGITDKITAEIDLLPLVGGLFQEPYLPVPSLNFRFNIRKQRKWQPEIAFETMFQHLWRTQNQADLDNLRIERQGGNSWYNRINMSWYNQKKLHFHFSAGVTYTENLLIENKDSLSYSGQFFKNTVNPDISFSVEYRPKPYITCHFTSSYGTTFVYLDNIPRKYQISYGFRVAPFHKNKFGILNSFRAEFIGFYMYLPDAQSYIESVVPIFPYLYWQWDFKKKRNGKR